MTRPLVSSSTKAWSGPYSWSHARKDLLAGLTVAAISLPQGMAYALIAGVDPRFGLYSAIVVTTVAAIFGSSNHLINGPTNAISLVVFSALAFTQGLPDAPQAMCLLAIMAGIIQVLMAIFRLGDLTRYISESVVTGFMTGASFLIAIGQVANFLGLKEQGNGHQHVLYRLWLTLTQGGPVNGFALGIGLASVALVIALRAVVKRYRLAQIEMLTSLIIVSIAAAWFGWSIPSSAGKTLIGVVGSVPATLPVFHVPSIHWAWLTQMSGSAFAVACLGLLEAFAIAKSIAYQTEQKLDYNRQCLAEGLANFTGGFFQCLPGSGSLTRSAINFQSGAVSRFSGLYTSVAVAIVVLCAAPLARFIPKAALAGLLLVTAARLVDWKRLGYTLRSSWYDASFAIITALSCVFINVEFSILIGVALSVILFVPRAARLRSTELVVTGDGMVRERMATDPPPQDLLIYDLEGQLFFGAAPELDRYFEDVSKRARETQIHYVILRFKRTQNPDVVFMETLERFLSDSNRDGLTVLLAGIRPDFAQSLSKLGFLKWLPGHLVFYEENRVYAATLKAVNHAYELMKEERATDRAEEKIT